jgi:release factor glutamine methyltransferase
MPDPRDGTVTWRELLAETTARLRAAGCPSPEVDARRIVGEACGADGPELALVLGERATERGVARLDAMVARRSAGEPLQYVLGRWGFRRLDLMVDRRVLIPRPETEQVVEVALAELDRLGGRDVPTTVVDLGTGSGAIGLSVAVERVRASVWLTDLSEDALAVAVANLVGVGRAAARVRTAAGLWFEALPDDLRGAVHLVVSNPPYVGDDEPLPAEVADWEPAGALRSGRDGTEDLRAIVTGAPVWLVDGGALVCELSPEQADVVAALAERHFSSVRVAPDLAGRARALVAVGPRPATP